MLSLFLFLLLITTIWMCRAKSFLIESIWLCLHVAFSLPHKQMDDRTSFSAWQQMNPISSRMLIGWFFALFLQLVINGFTRWDSLLRKITHCLLAGWENHVTKLREHAKKSLHGRLIGMWLKIRWKSGLKSLINDRLKNISPCSIIWHG